MTHTKTLSARRIVEFVFGFVPAFGLFLYALVGVFASLLIGLSELSHMIPVFIVSFSGLAGASALMIVVLDDARVRYKYIFIFLLVLGLLIAVFSVWLLNPFRYEVSLGGFVYLSAVISVSLVALEQIYRLLVEVNS